MLADQDVTFSESVNEYASYLGSQVADSITIKGRGLAAPSVALIACCSLAALTPIAEGRRFRVRFGRRGVTITHTSRRRRR